MENESSEADDYYNKSTINYLIQQCVSCTDIKPFPKIEKLKKFLHEIINRTAN